MRVGDVVVLLLLSVVLVLSFFVVVFPDGVCVCVCAGMVVDVGVMLLMWLMLLVIQVAHVMLGCAICCCSSLTLLAHSTCAALCVSLADVVVMVLNVYAHIEPC